VEAVVAIIAAGFGAIWWQRFRWTRAHKSFLATLDADAEVAIHVAQHEARSRGHETLTSFHLLYGALQIETLTDAMTAGGGDVTAVEDRVLAVLDEQGKEQMVMTEDAQRVLAHLYAVALHNNRRATAIDLWSSLIRSQAAALLEGAKIDGRAVLVSLVHGAREPEIALSGPDVFVVLRNDDHTTQEFVAGILCEQFGKSLDEANALTMEIHTKGRGIVCRIAPSEARSKIEAVRDHAKRHGFPLWIATEPT
jgi:ATP-dependent Clp protease adaptor protein ClpS